MAGPRDSLFAMGIAGVGLAVSALPPGPWRLVAGALLVLVAPGLAAQALLFEPRRLRALERAALTGVLSLILSSATALAAGASPLGLGRWPILVAIAAVTFVFAGAALIRHRGTPPPRFSRSRSWSWTPRDAGLAVAVAAALVLAGWASSAATRAPPAPNTQLYLLDAHGQIDAYPRTLIAGVPAYVRLGIASLETAEVTYTLRHEALSGGESEEISRESLTLDPGARIEWNVTVAREKPGLVTLRWTLWREGDEAAYRAVHLHVEVVDAADSPSPPPP